jgi:hypothetical protein
MLHFSSDDVPSWQRPERGWKWIILRDYEQAQLTRIPIDPRPPTSRIRTNLPPKEDRPTCLRWLPVRQLRQGPRRARILDRGAEDCEEGAQGVSAEALVEDWYRLEHELKSGHGVDITFGAGFTSHHGLAN